MPPELKFKKIHRILIATIKHRQKEESQTQAGTSVSGEVPGRPGPNEGIHK